MIAIAFRFTANRYHATQWGRHVNEGVLEWPPSPWRILRCLVSTWRRTLPDLTAEDVVPVLELLAEELPCFYLPPATAAHTRHYMPWEKKGPDDRTMVIDSFVVIEPTASLVALWPRAELTPAQQKVLSAILDNLCYLGRAESWCEASVVESPPAPNCLPMESTVVPQGDVDIVRVLVPRKPLRLRDLCVETGELRAQGRIDPPGAQWVLYTRPADCFSPVREASVTRAGQPGVRPTVVRYTVATNVPPLLIDTLRVAELARRAAMSQYGRQNNRAVSRILSGKAADGTPLEGHQHAFYLPTDEDEDGRLDHLTVWASGGLGDGELRALGSLDTLKPGDGHPGIRLAFQGYGNEDDFREASPIFRKSRAWHSVTPFVPNRHPKWRGPGKTVLVDGPDDQVRKEVQRRGIAVTLETVEPQGTLHPKHWRAISPLEFYRWRKNGPPVGSAHSFRLVFSQPVDGPIALGYGCHFGLGLFAPEA